MEQDRKAAKTVLVVDDEELVRNVARLMIERLGYGVLVAADGEAGLEVFRENRSKIAAVVLDMTMPRMGGLETLEAIHALDPGVPVVLTSGYGEQDAAQRFEGRGLAGFLQKPFQLPTLRAMLEGIVKP